MYVPSHIMITILFNAAPTCTNGKQYTECGTMCPRTCENKDKNIICPMMCVAGCFCPSGMVLENNACIQPSQCPGNGKYLYCVCVVTLYLLHSPFLSLHPLYHLLQQVSTDFMLYHY